MKHFIYNILAITLALSFVNCGGSKKESNNDASETEEISNNNIKLTKAQFEQSAMKLDGLEEKSFPVIVKTNGMIDVPPENRAVVSATMGGYIKKTPLLIGDIVKKGQVLVTIENPEFVSLQQEYLEIKEQLVYLKSEYERQKTLFDENITSKKNYLKTQSEYKTAQAKYNGLRKQLSMLNISPTNVENGTITTTATIYAPISGSITKMNVTKGTFVSPATPIMEIIDNDHIHIELSVFEKDIMKVKKDQRITFKIPEASTGTFEAEVHLIGTSINENRTIKVHGHPKDESKNNFLIGMFVEASIITDSIMSKAIPSEAIVAIDNSSYVLILESENGDEYTFKQIEVKTGSSYEGYTAIDAANTFDASTRFLTKGVFNLVGE
ncbi:Probable Co/Zn/Cd efflux system membrane fusion protein [hydrothermal vent metagenome]|uniref:Probable Co/Zn/Cd efflux system membrane fusion protein n=1 Tax=hydrothermal vent metagenome TaxID=652676 RepID=A0A3B0TI92_9ZZZZ